MKAPIGCVFFDLGDVLVEVHPERLEEALFESASPRASAGEIIDFYNHSREMRLYTEGKMDSSRFFTRIKRRFRLDVNFHDFYRMWNGIFTVKSRVCSIVKKIDAEYPDILLGVLSNTNSSHYEYLKEDMDVLGRFDIEVVSYLAGSQKPAREIYAEAVKKAGCPAKRCFFTDDLQKNIQSARVSGMRAFRFESAEKLKKDLSNCGVEL